MLASHADRLEGTTGCISYAIVEVDSRAPNQRELYSPTDDCIVGSQSTRMVRSDGDGFEGSTGRLALPVEFSIDSDTAVAPAGNGVVGSQPARVIPDAYRLERPSRSRV